MSFKTTNPINISYFKALKCTHSINEIVEDVVALSNISIQHSEFNTKFIWECNYFSGILIKLKWQSGKINTLGNHIIELEPFCHT